jgi:hypothetical protein
MTSHRYPAPDDTVIRRGPRPRRARWICAPFAPPRPRHSATAAVVAIEEHCHKLRPVCSAQHAATGTTCGAPAVAVAAIHAIDGCRQLGLSAQGDVHETLCGPCLAGLQQAVAAYLRDKRESASARGTHPVCGTCGRPSGYLHSVFTVGPIRTAGRLS